MNEREASDHLSGIIQMTEGRFSCEDIYNEDFTKTDTCHDWRNHIDEDVIAVWADLPESAKLVAYIHAADLAEREEWD